MQCPWCAGESRRFDFGRRCCRVRFLLGLPSRLHRQGWLERFEAVYGEAAAAKDRQALVEAWRHRPQETKRQSSTGGQFDVFD